MRPGRLLRQRYQVLFLVWIVLIPMLLTGLSGCAREDPRPNVILIVLDTVRRDHLSCYGYERPTSPNLDRLALESVFYKNAISAAPWTLPSHASMFTGLLPSRHQVHHEHLDLDETHQTLAERLSDAGYQTIGYSNNPWVTRENGMARGFQRHSELWRTRVSQGTEKINIFVDPATHGMNDAGAAETLRNIQDWLAARNDPQQPFFLFINLIEAHTPYDPPENYRNRFTSEELTRDQVKQTNIDCLRHALTNTLTEEELDRSLDLYDGEIAYVDAWMGKFLKLLEEEQILDSSLLMVTSDHGEAFAEHSLCGVPLLDHQLSLHRELLDVPLIVRYPAINGVTGPVETPVSLLDLFPTVLQTVGLSVPDTLDGQVLPKPAASAEGATVDSGQDSPRILLSEYYRPLNHVGLLRKYIKDENLLSCLADHRLVAMQVGDRKTIASSAGVVLSFDLSQDAAEQNPVHGEDLPEGLAEQTARYLEAMASAPKFQRPELSDEMKKELRSLGYVR